MTAIVVRLSGDARPAMVRAAADLLGQYKAFVEEHSQPGFRMGRLECEIADLPASYCDPGSAVLVAFVAAVPAGCVAIRPMAEEAGSAELKRMWVRPDARGDGVGAALVRAAINAARGGGYTGLCLDTEPGPMAAAVRLYLRAGFVECAPFRTAGPELRFFRLAL